MTDNPDYPLANFMHLSDAQGWDFEELLRRARNHYYEETEGEEAAPKADPSFAEV